MKKTKYCLKNEAKSFYKLKQYFHDPQLNLGDHSHFKTGERVGERDRGRERERGRISVCFGFVLEIKNKKLGW